MLNKNITQVVNAGLGSMNWDKNEKAAINARFDLLAELMLYSTDMDLTKMPQGQVFMHLHKILKLIIALNNGEMSLETLNLHDGHTFTTQAGFRGKPNIVGLSMSSALIVNGNKKLKSHEVIDEVFGLGKLYHQLCEIFGSSVQEILVFSYFLCNTKEEIAERDEFVSIFSSYAVALCRATKEVQFSDVEELRHDVEKQAFRLFGISV